MLYTLPRREAVKPAPTGLVQALNDEAAAMAGLVELLTLEQQALVQGEADRLEPIAQQKSSAIELLSQLGAARERSLAAQACGQGPEALPRWCQRNPALGPSALEAWQALLDRAMLAQQLNIHNGQLIETRLRDNRARLDALLCAVPAGSLYRPDGHLRRIDRQAPARPV